MDSLCYDLPGMSPVGLGLIALLNTPGTTVKQIAVQAELDPAIFGNIVGCANSPAYTGLNKSTDILASLLRLGQREVRRIVFQVVLRGAFHHESQPISTILRRIWLQSLATNVSMHKLTAAASESFALDQEEARFAECLGLLHNIGYLVLLANFPHRFLDFFSRHEDLPLPAFFDQEQRWFHPHDHFSCGRAVLEVWNFPRSFSEIVAGYKEPAGEFRGSHPRLHGMLRLSRHAISMTEYAFHPVQPDGFWMEGAELPDGQPDFSTLIPDVRQSVQHVEASFS